MNDCKCFCDKKKEIKHVVSSKLSCKVGLARKFKLVVFKEHKRVWPVLR